MLIGAIDPVCNNEDWEVDLLLEDEDDGQPIDLTGATVELSLKDDRDCEVLRGSTSDGRITLINPIGALTWRFAASDMARLCPRTYRIGVRLTLNDETTALLSGSIAILDGVVR